MTVVTAAPTPPAAVRRALGVPLSGRRVALERLQPHHLPALYEIATASDTAEDWPLCGQPVPAADFEAFLWALSRTQFAVVRRDTGQAIGLVQAVGEDLRNRTADLAVVVSPRMWRAGWPLEAAVLFVDYLFNGLGFRKLYLSMTESTLRRLGRPLHTDMTLECTYTRHVRQGDHYEDLSVFALHRDRWDTAKLRRFTGN